MRTLALLLSLTAALFGGCTHTPGSDDKADHDGLDQPESADPDDHRLDGIAPEDIVYQDELDMLAPPLDDDDATDDDDVGPDDDDVGEGDDDDDAGDDDDDAGDDDDDVGDDDDSATVDCPAPLLYSVADAGMADSQLFTWDAATETATDLGPPLPEHDIEALDTHPTSGELYAIAGGDGQHDGELYLVDKSTGTLTLLGAAVMSASWSELAAAAFHPDGTLWAFEEGFGLVTVDLATAATTFQWAVDGDGIGDDWEGLAWDPAGDLLYGSEDGLLYAWDPVSGTAEVVCGGPFLPGEVEALDFDPDGVLFGGSHSSVTDDADIFDIDPVACTTGAVGWELPYYDIESLAFELCP